MRAYALFDNLEVLDPQKLEEYKDRVAEVIARYEGRYLVRGGPVEILEGSSGPAFPVMIEFPSLAHARRWYRSKEYAALKALRLSAVRSSAVLLAGLGE